MSSEKNRYTDTIGKRLRIYRKKKKENGTSFAKKIGISQGSLSELENDKSKPSADTLANLCRNTDINIEWLLTGRGETTGKKNEFLDEIQEWLGEMMDNNPETKSWFKVQFEYLFPMFKDWKKRKEEPPKQSDSPSTSNVA